MYAQPVPAAAQLRASGPTSSAREAFHAYQAGRLELAGLLDELRRFYYSLQGEARREVVQLLGAVRHIDASRELMSLYRECEWRTTRFAILQALSEAPFQRSLEFLMRVANERADLPLSEAAVWSLGQSHAPLAARFLVSTWRSGPAVLRPAVTGALGQVPDHTLTRELLAELPLAVQANDLRLAKQVILTLAELKVEPSIPLLLGVLRESHDTSLRTCALLALGKLTRSPADLDPFVADFRADPLGYQMFLGARGRAQVRAQWSLEDHLLKVFGSPHPPASLALELNAFPPSDVADGLSLFDGPDHFAPRLSVLAHLGHPDRFAWYLELADPARPDAELLPLLQSLSRHQDDATEPVLDRLRGRCLDSPTSPLFSAWFEAAGLCLPRADAPFRDYLTSPAWAGLSPAQRTVVLNHYTDFALAHAADPKLTKRVGADLERALLTETSPPTQARIIRAMAQIHYISQRVSAWVGANLTRDALTGSCLVYLEQLAPRQGMEMLFELLRDEPRALRNGRALLQAVRAQEADLPKDAAPLDRLLTTALQVGASSDVTLAALQLLARHPRRAHLAAVLTHLHGEERLQLAAIAAIKAFALPETIDALAEALQRGSESVAGRAVDALSTIGGARASRILLQLLAKDPENLDLCDKVVHSLQLPVREEHLTLLDGILQRCPSHPMLEGLQALRERLSTPSSGLPDAALGLDIPRIDADLRAGLRAYATFDGQVKVALRAAELPFYRPELYEGQLDKSTAVLGYCKALDLHLERELGKRLFFPALQQELYAFQRQLHAAGLAEESPNPARVLRYYGLEQSFTPMSLPLRKLVAVTQGVLSGKILYAEQWRILDGLRAWASVLLLFGLEIPAQGTGPTRTEGHGPLLPLKTQDRRSVISVARRLLDLQDLRNPIAHRQTLLDFAAIKDARKNAHELFNDLVQIL